jgi:hypothetical protein
MVVRRIGGIIAAIAGVIGMAAALLPLLVGNVAVVLTIDTAGHGAVTGYGVVVLSFLCTLLGIVAAGTSSRWPGISLICTTLLAVTLGGTLVAICMGFALLGGVLATIPGRRRAIVTLLLPRIS